PLNLIRLGNALLDNRQRFEQDPDMFQADGNLDEIVGIVSVVLSQIAVAEIDAPFEVDVVGGHILQPDPVVNAETRPAHHGHDVVPGNKLRYAWSDLFHAAEALMPYHEKIETLWSGAVLGCVDFLVGTVHTDAKDLYQNSASAGDVRGGRFGHL